MEKSSNSLVKTGGWREKHETNYSGKDGKTAKSLMIMIMMTMIITLMITKCVNYVFVIKFDLGCSESELLIDPLFFYNFIKVHQHTLSQVSDVHNIDICNIQGDVPKRRLNMSTKC